VYEGGIHTPALIRWTGKIAAGAALTQPICVQDLFPTLAAAAGVQMPRDAKIDGTNQWPAIVQGKRIARAPFIVASFDTALIDGDWKLIEFQGGTHALFDLKDDISENSDQASKRPAIVTQLAAELDALKKDLPPITAQRTGPVGGRPGGGGDRPPGPRGNGAGRPVPGTSNTEPVK
jgi:arylsulfatase A-like enzyme